MAGSPGTTCRPAAYCSTAILLALAATIALVALTLTGHLSLPLFVPLLVLATACFGLAAPSAAHGALDPIPDLAGIAGGLLTSVQMLSGALASLAVALLFPRFGALAMAGTMAVCALAALVIYLPCVLQQRRLSIEAAGD